MEDYSGRKPKKDGIKAHKAAQEKKGDWLGRQLVNRERKPQKEHSAYAGDDSRKEYTVRPRGGFREEYTTRPRDDFREEHTTRSRDSSRGGTAGRNLRNIGDEQTDRETRRRQAAARQKRRQKRQIQRLIVIGMLIMLLILTVLLVRAVAKGISKKTKEAKAKAEALELEKDAPKIEEASAVITTAGDIIMHKPFLESSVYYNGESYDYNAIFTYMKEIYEMQPCQPYLQPLQGHG